MRILLIAYEFPPSPSPGALRWKYLTREFGALGHDVHVLMPSVWNCPETSLECPVGVTMHRTFAGPFHGLTRWLAARKSAVLVPESRSGSAESWRTGLNWKGRIFEALQRIAALFIFPDIRGEWRPWGASRFRRLLAELQPDVVISSHEPATTLEIGLLAAEKGVPWVIDLGDPVSAPYTPPRWQRKAWELEAAACRAACKVVVTTESAKTLLSKRHALESEKVVVITQGFDDRRETVTARGESTDFYDAELLELFYAGRFYDFRRPHELVAAVESEEGIRLTIAAPEFPPELVSMITCNPGKFRLTGLLHHRVVLRYQSGADVLVSIGNDGLAEQIPGKVYEYLGSGRPILHLLSSEGNADPAAAAVRSAQRGYVVGNRSADIRQQLRRLKSLKTTGELEVCSVASNHSSSLHGWMSVARRYAVELENVCGRSTPRAPAVAGKNQYIHE